MSVKLREKELSDGRISLYLDIYHDRKRRYDFLEIYLEGKRTSAENKEKLQLAQQIRLDTEHQITVQKRGLQDTSQMNGDLFAFIAKRSTKKQQRFSTLEKHLKDFSKGKPIPFKIITKEWLLSFQVYLTSDTERVENSVNAYMTLLNTLLNEASSEEIIPYNPWKKVPSHLKAKYVPAEVETLEPEEVKQMMEHSKGIDSQVRQCFLFSFLTGFRWGDVSNLTRSSIRSMVVVDKDGKITRRKFVVFTQRKKQNQKNFPLPHDAIRILAERLWDERKQINNKREAGLKVEASPNFFPHYSIEEGDRANKRHGAMWYQLKKWVKQAGIKKRVHFHLTRHSFATLGLEKIGDLSIVSSLLGHKKLVTTQRYAHVLDRLKVDSIDRMTNHGFLK
ncbi:MAG: site-specific integrase [Bacteroidia bacterium]